MRVVHQYLFILHALVLPACTAASAHAEPAAGTPAVAALPRVAVESDQQTSQASYGPVGAPAGIRLGPAASCEAPADEGTLRVKDEKLQLCIGGEWRNVVLEPLS